MPSEHSKQILSLWAAVQDFIDDTDKPFSLNEIVAAVTPLVTPRPNLSKEIGELLPNSEWVFRSEGQDTYIARGLYWEKAQFRICPTDKEVQQKILLVGHRFLPFCSMGISPLDIQIRASGKNIKQKAVKWTLASLLPMFSIFGWEGTLDYLLDDHPDNEQLLGEEGLPSHAELDLKKFELTVFDMGKFYKDHNFKTGDQLLLTVRNWYKGTYQVDYLPAGEVQADVCRGHYGAMEDNLLKLDVTEGCLGEGTNQLALALFMIGKGILQKPGFELDAFLAQMQKLSLLDLESNTLFWKKGEVPPSLALGKATGEMIDDADAFMADMPEEMPMYMVELEARIRAALQQGSDCDKAWNHLMKQHAKLLSGIKKNEKQVGKKFKELWDTVAKEYDPKNDERSAGYRVQLLNLLDSHWQWIVSLDVMSLMLEQFASYGMEELAFCIADVQKLLVATNQGDAIVKGIEKELSQKIPWLTLQFKLLMEDVECDLKSADTMRLSKELSQRLHDSMGPDDTMGFDEGMGFGMEDMEDDELEEEDDEEFEDEDNDDDGFDYDEDEDGDDDDGGKDKAKPVQEQIKGKDNVKPSPYQAKGKDNAKPAPYQAKGNNQGQGKSNSQGQGKSNSQSQGKSNSQGQGKGNNQGQGKGKGKGKGA